jgi:small subunit ribosomal protein S17
MVKEDQKIEKVMQGVVVSDAMDKTVVVSVDRVKTHRLYKKKFTLSEKHKAHDEENVYKVGDIVEITSTRPISKDKHHKVLRKVK